MDRESVIQSLWEGWRQAEHFQTQAEQFEAEVEPQRKRIAELEEQWRALHRSATVFQKPAQAQGSWTKGRPGAL